jgi:hypothetical protein
VPQLSLHSPIGDLTISEDAGSISATTFEERAAHAETNSETLRNLLLRVSTVATADDDLAAS